MVEELIHQFEGFGTGALPLTEDWRDYNMACVPGIAPMVGAAPAADDHLLPFIKGVYNQGSLPSCVIHSEAGLSSINEQMERGQWVDMDPVKAYYALGGNGSNGIDTRTSLQYFQTTGMPVLSSALRYKIANYAFAQPREAGGVEAVKAAIATGHPCVLAMLLPTDFMSGMSAGNGAVNRSAYHQICIVGYTPERVIYLNSWGNTFGSNGMGSVPWAYLLRPEQAGFVYAYTVTDAPDDGTPTPLPPDPPIPVPPPVPLGITTYVGSTGSVPSWAGGALLTVVGTGFDVGVLQARFNEVACPIESKNANQLQVRLPSPVVSIMSRLVVQREAESVSGPLLAVGPAVTPPPPPPPPPVGDLAIVMTAVPVRGSVGWWTVNASCRDSHGALVNVDWTGTIGTTPLPFRPSASVARWNPVKTDTGTRLVVVASAHDGRSATETRVLE